MKLEGRSSKDHIRLRFPFEEDQMIMKTRMDDLFVYCHRASTPLNILSWKKNINVNTIRKLIYLFICKPIYGNDYYGAIL